MKVIKKCNCSVCKKKKDEQRTKEAQERERLKQVIIYQD